LWFSCQEDFRRRVGQKTLAQEDIDELYTILRKAEKEAENA